MVNNKTAQMYEPLEKSHREILPLERRGSPSNDDQITVAVLRGDLNFRKLLRSWRAQDGWLHCVRQPVTPVTAHQHRPASSTASPTISHRPTGWPKNLVRRSKSGRVNELAAPPTGRWRTLCSPWVVAQHRSSSKRRPTVTSHFVSCPLSLPHTTQTFLAYWFRICGGGSGVPRNLRAAREGSTLVRKSMKSTPSRPSLQLLLGGVLCGRGEGSTKNNLQLINTLYLIVVPPRLWVSDVVND